MLDELPVGDKIYISSRRASDISGYAQDYIGQLARSGTVDAKRAGGLWYVDMESLNSYKSMPGEYLKTKSGKNLAVNNENLDPSILFDGKDYISANRASKITGYNQDYVGQLARSGKILSRQVGNRWFVDREGIVAHKQEKDALLASVQAESVGIYQRERNKNNDEIASGSNDSRIQFLKYIQDDGDLTPQIGRKAGTEVEIHRVKEAYQEDANRVEIPIHFVKDPSFQGSQPRTIKNKQGQSQSMSLLERKIPFAAGISIFVLLIIVVFFTVNFLSGSVISARMAEAFTQSTQVSSEIIYTVMIRFENLINPEIIYNR